MQVSEYLNSIYDSHDLFVYKFGKIDPETLVISETEKEILELILDIIRLNENYRQKENVFEQFNSKRLPSLNSITRENISSLLSLDLRLLPLSIRARIADFLWTTVKDVDSAKIAIDSYLELYELLWDEDNWPKCVNAVHRATNIAFGINKKGKEYNNCISAIKKGLNRTKGNDSLFLSSSLLEILAEQKSKVDSNVLQYARNAIESAKNEQNLNKAQIVLETLVKLDSENKNLYYEEAGDITQLFAVGPAVRRVHILNQALQYYKKAGVDEKLSKCRKQIEEAQSHILEEMHVIKTKPIDISSAVDMVLSSIRNTQSVKQAVIAIGDLVHIYRRDELFKYVEKDGSMANLFPSARVDHRGRLMYTLPPLSMGEKLDIDDECVCLHMWDKARWLQELNADIILKHAFAELNQLYQYSEEDLDFLVNNNAIIPSGREKIIRKGLYFGLQGDLYAAVHILIPQVESIIRHLVDMCGGNTFYIDKDGNANDYLIGTLLSSQELNDCYDNDILFCLKGLLDKKEGSNLRNEVAHGFLEPGNRSIEFYFVGFVIKLLSCYSMVCWEEREIMSKNKNVVSSEKSIDVEEKDGDEQKRVL